VGADGRLIDDFFFQSGPGMLHVLNAPSPAATAALAIGRAVADRLIASDTASPAGRFGTTAEFSLGVVPAKATLRSEDRDETNPR